MSYAYGNTGWKDLLTSYNGQSITYDTIGNPLSYRGMTLTWQNGRQLATLTKSGATSSYSYDINGNRTKKVAGGATTEYYLNEGTIVAEKKGSELIRYLFDENGSRYGLEWKGTKYYYVFNGQGDVIGITDPRNRLAVSYTYDAWGKLLSTGGDSPALAAANPIRYRGYYYDAETGLYYLNSRYYDPETGRFLNADGMTDGGAGLLGFNLFIYGANNPINNFDPTGRWIISNFIKGLFERSDAMLADPNLYTVSNWLTLGAVDTVKGAVQPEKPLSLQHWADSFATATMVMPLISKGVGVYDSITTPTVTKDLLSPEELLANGACFVAGTAVLTSEGLHAIENLKIGDMVWAENPETGEKALKEVVQTFVRETDELVHIMVEGEQIITTPEHPFYVPQKGWMGAAQLRAGDILVLSNGKYVTVEKVQHELLESPVKVYNFEVADFHTYYVGELSVLVHNACKVSGPTLPKNGTRLPTPDALDLAENYLGRGYTEVSPSRFLSFDGLRQVRMGPNDLLGTHGGGPHINFDTLSPKFKTSHIYFFD